MKPEDIKSKCDLKLEFGDLTIYVLILTHYDEIICSEVPYRGYFYYHTKSDEMTQVMPKDYHEWLFEYLYKNKDQETAVFYATKFLLESNMFVHSRKDLEKYNAIRSIELVEEYFIEHADRFSDITTAVAKLLLFYSPEFMDNFMDEIDQEKMGRVIKTHSFIKKHIINSSVGEGGGQIFSKEFKIKKDSNDNFEWEKELTD